MSTLGYVHHSGRYNRTGADLGAALVAQASLPGVSVIGVTETARKARDHGARDALAAIGWAYAHPEYAECGVAYDARRFTRVHARVVQVSNVRTWSHDGKLRAPFTVLFVLLREDATGLTYLVTVGHTPSHVATRRGWYRNHRARQHRDGLKGWRHALTYFRRHWRPTGGVVLSVDLNLDLRQRWVRTYLRASFPGLTLVQDSGYVHTHDTRCIDAVLVDRRLRPRRWFRGRRIRVVSAKDSDHRSIITRLARNITRLARKARR